MGSDGNKMNDGTGFQPTEPTLCANGCGFFGSASNMNLCSKCYRYLRMEEEQASSAQVAMEKLVDGFSSAKSEEVAAESSEAAAAVPTAAAEPVVQAENKLSNRCSCCKKKVGVLGFKCRCGANFCGSHRYPEQHECSFDFKAMEREAIAKANPVVKADKIDRF